MSLISVTNLSFDYPDGRKALKDVSFDIEAGERTALVGLNGAGKSTLLLCLAGVLRPKGHVSVEGVESGKRGLKDLNRVVGLVFQDPNDQLFMPTLAEDVAFGPVNLGLSPDQVAFKVQEALSQVGLDGYGNRLTHHMSFGEKKRAALATILAMEPRILLMDEPTSNLDPKRRKEFIHIMRDAKQAMLIATHDLSMARQVCPRVLAMRDGALVFDGSSQILDDPSFLSDMELDG